ncbi:MAG: phenylalanine--tRNA ligase subunit beta, partial [Gorillibacterium sp.]|nr:phenylalanine--tRNA ligase subunit beta [Gorillibacterium sp.]
LYASGQSAMGIVETATKDSKRRKVSLSMIRVNRYLGTELSTAEVKSILDRLHFSSTADDQNVDLVHVDIPGRRGDIEQDVDLIEEVARLYGYDHIPVTLMSGVTTPGALSKEQHLRRNLRNLLSQSGLNEAITYSFMHPAAIQRFPGAYTNSLPIRLAMPMSEDRSVLRTSLIPQLLEAARYNRNRSMEDVALFEIGKVFLTKEETLTRQPEEKQLLAILLTGNRSPLHWVGKQEKVDFFDLKGMFEKVTLALGISGVRYQPASPVGLHPGRAAEIIVVTENGEQWLGRIGQLHPELQAELDLDDTYVLEVELDTLIRYAGEVVEYHTLPRYPAVNRDIAVVVAMTVSAGDILAKAREVAGDMLENSGIIDVYIGERLGEGRKSIALTLMYRNRERTMTDEEVADLHGRVLASLEQTFAAELRK